MRLSSKIINKLRGLDLDRQLPLLKAIWTLQLGNMADAKVLETGPVMYLAGFCKLIKNDQAIVFAVSRTTRQSSSPSFLSAFL
jgi:hypothetical protein